MLSFVDCVVEALVLFDSLLLIGLVLLTLTLPSHGLSFTLFIIYLLFIHALRGMGYPSWLSVLALAVL